MSDPDPENLIAHFSGGLDPADREAFRHAALNAWSRQPAKHLLSYS
jgi:hypothetical protein